MICNEQINACNAIMIFVYINGHSSHFPLLNHGCKIECLHFVRLFSSQTCVDATGNQEDKSKFLEEQYTIVDGYEWKR